MTTSFIFPSTDKLMVWIGPPFFATEIPPLGWEVIRVNHAPPLFHTWESILKLTGGRVPHVVVVADASLPPLVTGMETFPCLTVFYAVDTHIHSWYPFYAQGFDLCLISLKDHLELFHNGRHSQDTVLWTPAHTWVYVRPPAEQPPILWDVLFVGTVDPELTPERHAFLTELKQKLPSLHITRGNFCELYPQAKLVLNECRKGDLNFRVFEALGCGACLLTPAIGNGLLDLFTDGDDLVTYPQHDVAALLPLVHRLLQDDAERKRIAANGLAAVDAAHRAPHRAKAVMERIEGMMASGEAQTLIAQRHREAQQIHNLYLRMIYLHHAENMTNEELKQQYLKAAVAPKLP